MQDHVAAALSQQHTFSLPTKLEIDAQFVIEACARLGPDVRNWRYAKFKRLS